MQTLGGTGVPGFVSEPLAEVGPQNERAEEAGACLRSVCECVVTVPPPRPQHSVL